MLARLDAIPGVLVSRVDPSGCLFLLEVEVGSDPTAVAEMTRAALPPNALPLSVEATRDQAARLREGEVFFSRSEIRRLSWLETRVLVSRLRKTLMSRFALSLEESWLLAEELHRTIGAAVDRRHAAGGAESSAWFYEEWPTIVDRTLSRPPLGSIAGREAGLKETLLGALRQP